MPGEPVTLTSKDMRSKPLETPKRRSVAIKRPVERCYSRRAWQSLANLKTYKFESEVANGGPPRNPALRKMDRVYLHFGLGKAYEDRCEYALAFSNYAVAIRSSGLNRDTSPNICPKNLKNKGGFWCLLLLVRDSRRRILFLSWVCLERDRC